MCADRARVFSTDDPELHKSMRTWRGEAAEQAPSETDSDWDSLSTSTTGTVRLVLGTYVDSWLVLVLAFSPRGSTRRVVLAFSPYRTYKKKD